VIVLVELRVNGMAKDILAIIEGLKDQASQKYKAEIKGIFGSYVRGNQTSESDIDVLVDFHRDADLFDFVGLSLFLEEHLGHKVDVVPLSSLREEIRDYVMNEVVYL
jgi:predicted nucleotidyltransferase